MNKFTHLFMILSIFLLIGCSDNETASTSNTEEQKTNENEETEEVTADDAYIEKLMNYETIELEYKDELVEVTIEYPQFSYAPIDKILSSEMEAQLKSYSVNEDFETLGRFGLVDHESRPYIDRVTFEKPIITDKYVSIYFDYYHYMGQVSVTPYAKTFNFDLENERVMTIHDVINEHDTSLEVISAILADKLIHDERFAEYRDDPVSEQYKQSVEIATIPTEMNYSKFTLDEDSITIYNFYPSILPNSAGIVGIEISWDEVKQYTANSDENIIENEEDTDAESISEEPSGLPVEFGQSVKTESALKYVNQEYGFSLELPESWKGEYFVQELVDTNIAWMKEPSKIYAFSMAEEDKYIGDLFIIAVIEGISAEEVSSSYPEGEFIGYVGSGQDFVLVSSRPGELPDQLYEEPYIETGNKFAERVGEVYPKILETLVIQ